jgi:hypothetical protein
MPALAQQDSDNRAKIKYSRACTSLIVILGDRVAKRNKREGRYQ